MPQYSLNGPPVELEIKCSKDLLSDCCSGETELSSLIYDESNDFRGEFVGFTFPLGFINKPCDALFSKGFQSLIKGFPRITKLFADLGYEMALMRMGPEHLILHLAPIQRVEKLGVFLKQSGRDTFLRLFHKNLDCNERKDTRTAT